MANENFQNMLVVRGYKKVETRWDGRKKDDKDGKRQKTNRLYALFTFCFALFQIYIYICFFILTKRA